MYKQIFIITILLFSTVIFNSCTKKPRMITLAAIFKDGGIIRSQIEEEVFFRKLSRKEQEAEWNQLWNGHLITAIDTQKLNFELDSLLSSEWVRRNRGSKEDKKYYLTLVRDEKGDYVYQFAAFFPGGFDLELYKPFIVKSASWNNKKWSLDAAGFSTTSHASAFNSSNYFMFDGISGKLYYPWYADKKGIFTISKNPTGVAQVFELSKSFDSSKMVYSPLIMKDAEIKKYMPVIDEPYNYFEFDTPNFGRDMTGIIGGYDTLSSKVVYPEAAKKAGVSGRVSLWAYIDEFGKVVGTRLISGIGAGCDEAAVDAIRQVRYHVPANAQKRKSWESIDFELERKTKQYDLQCTKFGTEHTAKSRGY
ncbi:MAG: energy transducer TonB, partial [Ignavibacteriales bacterium]|nr:energy transducer TonB [Ignavibacteriales bacterium]